MDDDVGSMPYPVAHIGGPMQTMGAQLVGIPIVLLDPFVPPDAVETMRRFGVTQTGGGTAHYLAMIAEQRKHPDGPVVPTLRRMSGGGGAKPPEVFFELLDTLGIRCHHGYGMTECPYLASTSMRDTDEQLAYTDGLPLPDSEIRLVDQNGNDVPTGEIGEVWVRSPLLCRGYLDEGMTADAFTTDGFFRTGDLAHFRDDGRIRVTGRIKDIIIRKGENISALDVELVVRQLPGVADVAVIGVPDPDRGERVCAVIELHEGATVPSLDDVRRHCVAKGLMMQKIPEQIEVIDALPRNAFLKVVKPLLRQQFNK
jgi:acyl-CoA synthetase (AMP-forming)/AMP-acid ligase II